MPLFDYHCLVCKHDYEEFSNIKVDSNGNNLLDVPRCPKCGSDEVMKQISPCNFHLKGNGWAKDGYAKK